MAKYKYTDFDNLDDYDNDFSYEKIRGRKKKKSTGTHGGHVSRGSEKQKAWDLYEESYSDFNIESLTPPAPVAAPQANYIPKVHNEQKLQKFPVQKPEKPVQSTPADKPQYQFGPNTHEIKTIKIDFDRLDSIEQIDGEYNGHQTFGIKFIFKGNKGLFKIIWYGRNLFERDRVFAEEYKFWKSLGY